MAIDRRQFIHTAAGAVAAATFARRGLAAADTNDIRVAQIGFRSRGQEHIDIIRKNIVALCDVDEQMLHAQVATSKISTTKRSMAYTDFRKLLERKDIDAVSIATPNHTHSLIAIAAAQAGKHVYVEKPVSHDIWEGRQLVAAARQIQPHHARRNAVAIEQQPYKTRSPLFAAASSAKSSTCSARATSRERHRQARQAAPRFPARSTTTCGAGRPRR